LPGTQLKAEQTLLVVSLDQFADQRSGGDEANAMSALAGRQAQGKGNVRLTRATVAEQQDVFLAGQILASS
jgi:hypothetical protein